MIAVAVLLRLTPTFPAEAWPEAEERVAAELGLLGLTVAWAESHAADITGRLDELLSVAEQHRAVASIWISRAGERGSVQLWLQDRVTRKLVLRRVEAPDHRRPDAAGRVALQVVELLRASLLEIRLTQAPPPLLPPPVTAIVGEVLRAPSGDAAFVLRLGTAASLSSDRLHGLALEVAAQHRPARTVWLETALSAALAPARLANEAGSARVGWMSLRAQGGVAPWGDAAIAPAFGLGLGATWLWASGEGRVGYLGRSDGAISVHPLALVRLGYRLGPGLDLLAQASLALPLPRIEVRLGGQTVAGTGPVLVDVLLGVQWGPV